MAKKTTFSREQPEKSAEPAWLANQNAGFVFILPAHGFSHIITEH